jgi:hypothetical protein
VEPIQITEKSLLLPVCIARGRGRAIEGGATPVPTHMQVLYIYIICTYNVHALRVYSYVV